MTSLSTRTSPLTDAIVVAVSKLVDDAQLETYREPSHSEITFQIDKAGLAGADPKRQGQNLGKAKRIRAVLYWALENDVSKGGALVLGLLALIQGCGGFRSKSPNYVGSDAIETAIAAFQSEGYVLASDGTLQPQVLDNLSGTELSEALSAYVRRAKKGVEDAALLTGTSKDLLEATAAHVIVKTYGSYSTQRNFPTLLAQAFMAVSMALPKDGAGDSPVQRLERAYYEAACAINALRNKKGTGHGRPWIAGVTDADAKAAVETMGIVAERLLGKL